MAVTDANQPFVYILASGRNGTLYIGVTSHLARRVFEHREGAIPGFTRRYRIRVLVYFEAHETMGAAITRERQMNDWRRAWKIRLIEKHNPDWRDLYDELG